MAKIYHFPDIHKETETAKSFIEKTANVVEDEDIETVIIACKSKRGHWVTGYYKADFGTKNEALGHIQADIIDQMIQSNPERY